MTPADKRVAELVDRWLTSIELHLKYTALDEASYRQIQPWPEHERPTRWILEVAQQKILQLKSLLQMHTEQQDGSFAEGLELMCFLANLVGAQNIKRHVPIAEIHKERPFANGPSVTPEPLMSAMATPSTASAPEPITNAAAHATSEPTDGLATRELPALNTNAAVTTTRENDSTREMPRLKLHEPTHASPKTVTTTKRGPGRSPSAKPDDRALISEDDQQTIVADAVRLLKWGREWHELADLIARMAERPSASEVRRILKAQRKSIERQLIN